MTIVFNESPQISELINSRIFEITSCPEPRGIFKDKAAVGTVDRFGHDISTEIAKDLEERESKINNRRGVDTHSHRQTRACTQMGIQY